MENSEFSPVKLEPIEEVLLDDYCNDPDDDSAEYSDPGTSPLEVLETTVASAKRQAWSEESLVKAIEAVNENNYSFYKASIEFHIPRSTLIRQWKANKLTKNKIGRKRVLTTEQENILAGRIRRVVDTNYPVNTKYLRRCVYKFCEENHIKSNFSKDKEAAGSYWLKNFLQRYPDIVELTKQKLNPTLLQNSLLIVEEFFQKLQKAMLQKEIMNKPQFVYNIEYKILKINLATGLANLRDSDVQQANDPDDEEVKVICAGNAAGHVIPLMVVFKGEKLKNKWSKDFPLGAIAKVTSNGSVTSEAFNEWLRHFQNHRSAGPCLLILNENTVRLDYSVIQVADELGIELLCLPRENCLHDLRPIHRGCFKAFDDQWAKEIQEFWKSFNMGREAFKAFSRQTFGKVLTVVWNKVMTSRNIKSGFAATGIYPYNPKIVLKDPQHTPSSSAASSSIEVVEL